MLLGWSSVGASVLGVCPVMNPSRSINVAAHPTIL